MKRAFDLFVVLIALPIIFLFLLCVGLLVRFKLGQPLFFKQHRPGLHGKLFCMYKFRTMSDLRDSEGVLLPDIKRLHGVGQFLRSTSLDELPGLWNVFVGDMSLVGPRPLLAEYLPLYSTQQLRRHDVLPGITGWAQVNGRNAIEWDDRLRNDIWYVDNQSFWLDVRILRLTVLKVLNREGINKKGQVSLEKFEGSKID
jgi:sugar transferase EpsL|tara:strand:- start:129 stop:725 length:597 start_codon:yes stop_codon:yes gene_type:complete